MKEMKQNILNKKKVRSKFIINDFLMFNEFWFPQDNKAQTKKKTKKPELS
jgi:hypothetical protein